MVSYLLSDTSLSQAVSYTWLTLMPGYNAFSCDLLVLSRRGVAQLRTQALVRAVDMPNSAVVELWTPTI